MTLKIAIDQSPSADEGRLAHAYDIEEGTFPAHTLPDRPYTVLPDVDWGSAEARLTNRCPRCREYRPR